MTAFDTLDAVRALPDTALLQRFFSGEAAHVLADCDGSLVAILKRPAVSARQRTLLAGVELARRAALEEVGARTVMTASHAVLDFLRLHFLACEEERFAALWLDTQNRLLAFDELFRGTLTQTAVYPREIVKRGLRRNASAVIFAHNHPSGGGWPNRRPRMSC